MNVLQCKRIVHLDLSIPLSACFPFCPSIVLCLDAQNLICSQPITKQTLLSPSSGHFHHAQFLCHPRFHETPHDHSPRLFALSGGDYEYEKLGHCATVGYGWQWRIRGCDEWLFDVRQERHRLSRSRHYLQPINFSRFGINNASHIHHALRFLIFIFHLDSRHSRLIATPYLDSCTTNFI